MLSLGRYIEDAGTAGCLGFRNCSCLIPPLIFFVRSFSFILKCTYTLRLMYLLYFFPRCVLFHVLNCSPLQTFTLVPSQSSWQIRRGGYLRNIWPNSTQPIGLMFLLPSGLYLAIFRPLITLSELICYVRMYSLRLPRKLGVCYV